MKTFKDRFNRVWKISLDAAELTRVHVVEGIDLVAAVDLSRQAGPNVFSELAEDPAKIVALLYTVLEPQIKAAGMSEVDFAKAMTGYGIANAVTALIDELIELIGSHEARAKLKAIMEKAGA